MIACALHLLLFFLLCGVISNTDFTTLYSYLGYYTDFHFGKFALSTLLISLTAYSTGPLRGAGTSMFHLGCAIVLVPSMALFACMNLPYEFVIVTFASFVITCLTMRMSPTGSWATSADSIHPDDLLRVLIAASLLLFLVLIGLGQLRYFNLDFRSVYEYRSSADENIPHFLKYLCSPMAKVVAPTIVILGIIKRRPWIVAFGLSSAIMMFALTSHKSSLLAAFASGFAFLLARRGERFFVAAILVSLAAIVVVSAIDFHLAVLYDEKQDAVFGWFGSIFTRRLLIVPSTLNWYYIDYFQDASKFYYFSHNSFTLGTIDSQHIYTPPHLIGLAYFNNPDMSANAGFIGAGMAQLGYFGTMLYSVTLGLCLNWMNAISNRCGFGFVTAVCLIPMVSIFNSTDFTTGFISHGFALAIVIVTFCRDKTQIIATCINSNHPIATSCEKSNTP